MKQMMLKILRQLVNKEMYFSTIATVQIVLMLLAPLHIAEAGVRSSVQKALRGFAFNDAGVQQDDLSRAGVQSKKQTIPKVEIAFTNTEGDNYTAVAQVTGIVNPADAYYTWYIRNDTYDRTNKPLPFRPDGSTYERDQLVPGAEYMGDWPYQGIDCDSEFSDSLDRKRCINFQMERYKIAATRAHIATKFDVTRFDSEYNIPGGNGDFVVTNDEFPDVIDDADNFSGFLAGDVEDDEDGAVALVGGSDNFNGREDISAEGILDSGGDTDNYCYIYDYTSGDAFELVQGDPDAGFRCAGEIVEPDSEEWSVECLATVTLDSCSVPSDETTTSTTTSTETTTTPDDPDTPEDESSSTEDTTEEVVEESATGTRNRSLQSCERSPNSARCQYVAGNGFIPAQGVPFCLDGGVPVCVPRTVIEPAVACPGQGAYALVNQIEAIRSGDVEPETPETEADLLEQLNALVEGDVNDPAVYTQVLNDQAAGVPECELPTTASIDLDNRIKISEQCTPPRIYFLANRIQAIRAGEEVPEIEDLPESEAELLELLNELVGDDVNDPAVFNRLITDQLLDEDPNSFVCTAQGEQNSFVLPEVIEQYGLEPPSCGVSPPNAPNLVDGELYSEASGLVNICTESIHLAPFPFTDDINTDLYLEDLEFNFTTGDGKFGRDEERFWGTNPENAITLGEGVNDEELILGKGLSEFTWEYREGDEVGVVVEARGIGSTEHDSQNPFVSFVFMKYGCAPKNVSYYFETVRNKAIQFDTANMNRDDINLCLIENFATPGNVEENNNLTVEIDAPEGTVVNNQDFIIEFGATASNENASLTEGEIAERSVYDWKIYYSPDAQDPEADSIRWERFLDYNLSQSNPELFARRMEMLELKELKAVGLSDLELKANFDTDLPETEADEGFEEGLLRVTVEINAPTGQPGVTTYGRGESIIPLVSQSRPQLFMYRVNTDNLPIDQLEFNDLTRICDSAGTRFAAEGGEDAGSDALVNRDKYLAEDVACRTFRNEVLAFQIPDVNDFGSDIEPEQVFWEVNGERISCDTTLSPTLCQAKPPIVFLPSIQRDGEIQTVTASTSDPAAGIDANEVFSRSFVITPPKIVFEVGEGNATIQAQELGAFIPTTEDETAATTIEQSNTVFVRSADTFNIKAKLDPPILEEYAEIATGPVATTTAERVNITWDWIGREGEQGVSNLVETVTVPEELTDKPVTVKARVTTSTPQPIRELLLNKFQVNQYETSPLTTEGQATVHEPGYSTLAYLSDEQYRTYVKGNEDRNKTFTATVFGNTASYMLFILKISLTMGIILFISSFAMGGIPATDRRRRL